MYSYLPCIVDPVMGSKLNLILTLAQLLGVGCGKSGLLTRPNQSSHADYKMSPYVHAS